jgi:hypothetical protein
MNWYTTMDLAYKLYNKYGYRFCGTMVPTEKVSRQDRDVPFHKLSRGAKDSVERGWFREAAIELKTDTGRIFYAQCTTWKDRKQVMFVHTTDIGASSGHFVRRSIRGVHGRTTLKAPLAQQNYAENLNAVDRNDRDSSDYTTSIRTNRWYLRVLFWLFDRADHILYVIVVYRAKNDIGAEWWNLYLRKGGREEFQIDLGRELMAYAISLAWPDLNGPRPNWMRQIDFVPCGCKCCFFCLNGFTTGVAHKQKKRTKTTFIHHDNSRKVTKDCTDKRVNFLRGNSYCRQCYREGSGSKKEKMENIPYSRLGCPSCDEHVCDSCWEKGTTGMQIRGRRGNDYGIVLH